jgi:hypothetical protein
LTSFDWCDSISGVAFGDSGAELQAAMASPPLPPQNPAAKNSPTKSRRDPEAMKAFKVAKATLVTLDKSRKELFPDKDLSMMGSFYQVLHDLHISSNNNNNNHNSSSSSNNNNNNHNSSSRTSNNNN